MRLGPILQTTNGSGSSSIDETRVRVSLNGKEEFAPTDLKAVPEAGGIGLWVGRGTEGYFSNLRITPH